MSDVEKTTVFSPNYRIKINKWKVREGFQVNNNQLILLYELTSDGGGESGGGGGSTDTEIKRLKSTKCGVVKKPRPLLHLIVAFAGIARKQS